MDVVVGRIGRAHGIRGEVSVEVRTDDPARRFVVGAVLQTDPVGAGPLTVAAARFHGGRAVLALREVADRTAAEGLRGVLLTVPLDDSERPADPEEFYDHELVGLPVDDQTGTEVGVVAEVLHQPGHDVLVVRRHRGGEALVPFVTALVPVVDRAAGRVTVADRPGLLDPESLA